MNRSPGAFTEALSPEIRRLVTAACASFEERWRGAGRPAIEPLLEGLTSAERSAVLRQLIALEVALRSERGDHPSLHEYVERFPSEAAVVAAAFSTVQDTSAGCNLTEPHTPDPHVDGDGAAENAADIASTRTAGPERIGRSADDGEETLPHRLGRYEVLRLLGRGSFGRVFLARDNELDRQVAIKVPTIQTAALPGRLEALVAEARLAASLRHPAIVGVYDFGRADDGSAFIVLEFVEGTTLLDVLHRGRVEPGHLAALVATVADAVHHAHTAGLVHRDLKPSNIMIDTQGNPRVTDFGLAITEDLQSDRAGEVAGTPTHMAPEQVRGEAHRLDGRTDVWALGVVLYQGLTGRLPFLSRERRALFDEILHREPRPLRQIVDTVPRELERICLKCLSRQMIDRYQTAADLAEDLRAWLASTGPAMIAPAAAGGVPEAAPKVIPKGLRAFDSNDADFFLALLPGPRDRDGLPESLRFWKSWIEPRGGKRSSGVGLLYGPSGCGKSSMVRAGLLPRLSPHVRSVYVEASAQGTEEQLHQALVERFPGLPSGTGDLVALFASLRERRGLPAGDKALVIIDQFEQWLHARPVDADAELIRALRQCDGDGVQALVLVRDDFWMAVTRLFKALEVRLVEGGNSGAVELFDARHARRVLLQFGRAYGRAPDGPDDPEPELSAFLDRASAELAGAEGRVSPVRLAVLAEMTRDRPWTLATLRELGGFEGIGETFLEETFGASAPPTHRQHAQAAQAVLRRLLPGPDSDLKGAMCDAETLRVAAGYSERPGDFDDLIQILDSELRLVTPVDAERAGSEGDGRATGVMGYQLTHDYLVPSLRLWLTHKQRETRRGRAELRLASITESWRDRPEPKRLPSVAEWFGIVVHTRSRRWSADERRMMRVATRRLAARAAMVLAAITALGAYGWWDIEQEQSASLYRQALKSDFQNLPELLPEIVARSGHLRDRFAQVEGDGSAAAREREVASIVLHRIAPDDRRAAVLRERLLVAEPNELAVIRDVLAAHPASAGAPALLAVVRDKARAPGARLRAACALYRLSGAVDIGAAAPALADALIREDRGSLSQWLRLLGAAVTPLLPWLDRASRNPELDPILRSVAAAALAETLGQRGDAAALAEAIVEAPVESFRVLIRALDRPELRPAALERLGRILGEEAGPGADEDRKDHAAKRRAVAGAALLALGQPGPLWPELRHHDDPRLRSLLIDTLAHYNVNLELLGQRLLAAGIDPIERQAILMVFAETGHERIPPNVAGDVAQAARRLYLGDPHPGVHSAAELLMRRWPDRDLLAGADQKLRAEPANRPERGWSLGPNGHTLVILRGPLEFWMGAPAGEPGRYDVEGRHYRRIDRSLAISDKEVTLRQFRAFRPDHPQDLRYGSDPECPANTVSWYEAARYCNWLSAQAKIPRDQWAYPEAIGPNTELPAGVVEKLGFRLPTEAEWEYACRAHTLTSRPFGQSEDLLSRYAWTWLNSKETTWPVGVLLPNEFGLFDVVGNNWEWCHDGASLEFKDHVPNYPPGTKESPAADPVAGVPLRDGETFRWARGGAHSYSPNSARSAKRYVARVNLMHPYMGFRVARTLPKGKETAQSATDR